VQPAVGSGVNEKKRKTRSFARGMLAAAVLWRVWAVWHAEGTCRLIVACCYVASPNGTTSVASSVICDPNRCTKIKTLRWGSASRVIPFTTIRERLVKGTIDYICNCWLQ
jgi:hypothetical protein